MEFNFEIIIRPGLLHKMADTKSRQPKGGGRSPCDEKDAYDEIPMYCIKRQVSPADLASHDSRSSALAMSASKKIFDGQSTKTYCPKML